MAVKEGEEAEHLTSDHEIKGSSPGTAWQEEKVAEEAEAEVLVP
jgi:hypothetical protein